MQDIDFLPPQYRERNAARRSQLWLLSVAAMFALGVATTAAGQHFLRRSVVKELDGIQLRYDAAKSRASQLEDLGRQLQSSHEAAALYTYLQFPWPTSQLIAEVVDPLPDSIALAELVVNQNEVTPTQRRGGSAVQASEATPGARQDLDRLQQRFGQQAASVALEGRALDVTALHRYVAALGKSPLFASAKLESLESNPRDEATSFSLKLLVAAGYGQRLAPSLTSLE